MSRRVVMRLTKWSSDIGSGEKFFAAARSAGAGSKTTFTYAMTEDGEPCLCIELPDSGPAVDTDSVSDPLERLTALSASSGKVTVRKGPRKGQKPVQQSVQQSAQPPQPSPSQSKKVVILKKSKTNVTAKKNTAKKKRSS